MPRRDGASASVTRHDRRSELAKRANSFRSTPHGLRSQAAQKQTVVAVIQDLTELW
jgi:hypothetical protein